MSLLRAVATTMSDVAMSRVDVNWTTSNRNEICAGTRGMR